MVREGTLAGANGQPALYEEAEACTLSQLDVEIVRFCVSRKLITPIEKSGKTYFTGSDVLKLKLLRTLLLSRQLSASLDQVFLKVGRDLMEAPRLPAATEAGLEDIVQTLLSRFHR